MVRKHAPVITRTLRTLSNIRVRNVATVGGALAHADPHMDLPPVLIALGARVVVQGKSGERTIPVADLFAGYFETVLAKDELISSLIVPAQGGRRAAYLKCTTRAVHDWPALGVAVSVAADGKAIKDAAIVVSAATEKPGRLAGAEAAAKGAADDAAMAPRRRGGGGGGGADHRRAGLGRLQERARARLCGARAARRAGRSSDGDADDRERAGRALGAAAGRRGQGHRPCRLRAQSPPAEDADRKDLPQHGRAWPHQVAGCFARRSALPGVYRVVTIDDIKTVIPNPFYGPAFHDQPILADGKVHYVGEPVAVVLATDPHIAEEAASLIEAEYEELPAVFDEVEAMTSKAVVHDELKPAGTFPDLKHLKGKKDTNIALDFHLRRGDPQKAFAEAEHVFEHTFRSQQVLHVPLEPFVSVAELTETGLTIHTASQSPSFVRIEIARLLGWPENKVRVKVPYLGGGFGAKLYIKLEALVAALTLLVAAAGEDLAHHGRAVLYAHQARGDLPHQERGQERQGHRPRLRGLVERRRLCRYRPAHHAEVGLHRARAPTTSTTSSIDSYSLYTNLTPAGALRGFGIPQLVWAYESHTDMMARALKLDPVEFRRNNILREGRAAGDRHRDEGRRHRGGARSAGAAHELEAPFERGTGPVKKRPRHRGSASRPRSRRPPRSRSSMSRPTAASRSIAAPSTWGRAPTPPMRSSSPRCSTSRPSR